MKKKLAKATVLLLCMALCLTGCGGGPVPENSSAPADGVKNDAETGAEVGGKEAPAGPSAQDYYRYLSGEVLDEFRGGEGVAGVLSTGHLADTEPHELKLHQGDFCEVMSFDNSLIGVMSAVVEDFDGDGVLEMLVISSSEIDSVYSLFADALYSEADFSTYDENRRSFHLYAALYDWKDGEIFYDNIHSPGAFIDMPLSGWGYMAVGLEKLGEGDYYLYATTRSEDLSTYGPSYGVVTSVPGQLIDYVSGVSAYGLSETEANKLIHRDVVYDFSDTTIHDRFEALGRAASLTDSLAPDEEVFRAELGGGLICMFNVSHPEWGGDKLIHKITDWTNLRHYLENDAADWTPLELPEGGNREVPEGPEGMAAFAEAVSAASGVELRAGEAAEKDGVWSQSFEAQEDTLSLSWSASDNRLTYAGLYSSGETPTQEWYTLKDALLDNPAFGWDNGEADFLKGEVSWNDYFNGVDVGEWSCMVAQVTSSMINIRRK